MRVDNGKLPTGKLPSEILERLLKTLPVNNRDVIIGPGIGNDAAIIDFSGIKLIFKTDPITFLSEDIISYLITVNSNDIACMGGVPRYLLVTLLLPEGITAKTVEELFSSLRSACSLMDIALVGGHTEITHGIDRPLAIGFMIGSLEGKPLGASGARPGDVILLSKGIPLEAVSILARLVPDKLGLSEEMLKTARDLIYRPGISVLKEAKIAAALGATALHDPTESGLSAGLYELARASGCGIEVDFEKIPVLAFVREALDKMHIDPLGAISSGSLIACSSEAGAKGIIDAWHAEGIQGSVIGRATKSGLRMIRNGKSEKLPEFSRDEIARFLGL